MSPAFGAFAPLRHSVFRSLWIANLASNTGIWLQNAGAGWLMTSLAPSPVMGSLVQAAAMLPVFLFALPGGALADIFDRRLALIAAQLWMVVMGVLLALLTGAGALGLWSLLALTFAIGAGTAMNFPAWAAATPELVPRDDGWVARLSACLSRSSCVPVGAVIAVPVRPWRLDGTPAPALGGGSRLLVALVRNVGERYVYALASERQRGSNLPTSLPLPPTRGQ